MEEWEEYFMNLLGKVEIRIVRDKEGKRIEERGKVTEAIKKLRDGKTMRRDEILREV